MKKYELVLFDADNTLFDYTASEKEALEKALESIGLTINDEISSLYSKINKNLWTEYEKGLIQQSQLRTERFKILFEQINYPADPIEISKCYVNFLSESCIEIENSNTICALLSKKCKLGIITNGISQVQRKRISNSSISNFIDYLIISEEANCNKPSIEIFLYAEEITKIREKDKILIVGDSLSSDILGGINYCIDTCWFNPSGLKNDTKIQPVYEINNLIELKEIIDLN